MAEPFVGSEALACGQLSKYTLRSRYVALYPNVYVPRDTSLSAVDRAKAAWLWSQRRGVIAGQSASALHGAKWVDDRAPAELLYGYRRAPIGIRTWSDRFDQDDIQLVDGMLVTTPARTALDIACRYPLGEAVARIDSLARATRFMMADVELLAKRYNGRRGIRRARAALPLVDPGAESPRETWLRLLLIRAGFPPPRTQIPVYDEYGQLVAIFDMGWEHIKVAIDYEGDHHWMNRRRFNHDIRRAEAVTELGWIDIRVTAEDAEAGIILRVRAAWERRMCSQDEKIA
jgi:hypothetical protein